MGKNIAIGLLAVLLLGFGIYMATRSTDTTSPEVVDNTPQSYVTPATYNTPASGDNTPAPGLPTVETRQTASVSSSTAFLSGQINPNGPATSYWYEYGETQSLGLKTAEQGIGSGFSNLSAAGFVSGLKSNTTYYFRLTGKNIYGTVNGTTYTFKTNTAPAPTGSAPAATTNNASDITRVAANLKGSVDANGAETSYWFEYGPTTGFGNSTAVASIGNGNNALNVTTGITNLQPLTRYYYRVIAQNQFGTVNGRTLNFTTAGPAASSQPAVDTTAATDVQSATAQLNGRVNPSGAATTYWFEYSKDSLLGSLIGTGTGEKSAGSGTSNVDASADITGLTKDTKYYYRVVARNANGTVRGDIVSFTTKK